MDIKTRSEINHNLISEYRSLLFGVSTILIVLFHYATDIKTFGGSTVAQLYSITFIDIIGSSGVDVFVFLSGIGSYYSLKRKFDYKKFIIKRLIKILIPYLIVAIPFWLVLDFIIKRSRMSEFIIDLTFISFFINGVRDYWYICFILISYLFIPSIFKYLYQNESSTKLLFPKCCLLSFFYFSIMFLLGYTVPGFVKNTEIMLGRFITIFFGLITGRLVNEKTKIKKTHLFILSILLIFTNYCKNNIKTSWIRMLFNRWNLGIRGCLIIIFFCMIRALLPKKPNKADKILNYIGSYSLELYLVHVSIRGLLYNSPHYSSNLVLYLVMISTSMLLCLILKTVTKRISKRLFTT